MAAVSCPELLEHTYEALHVVQAGHPQGNGLRHLQGMVTEVLILGQFLEGDIMEFPEHLLSRWRDCEDPAKKKKKRKEAEWRLHSC